MSKNKNNKEEKDTREICKNCKYVQKYTESHGGTEFGFFRCYFNPPILKDNFRPKTQEEDTCSFFKQKED